MDIQENMKQITDLTSQLVTPKNIKPEILLLVRNVLSRIMNENRLNHNNAFVHVKNYITNMYCDIITQENTEK